LTYGEERYLIDLIFEQDVFPEILKFTVPIISETMISKCPSRLVMRKGGRLKGLSVETEARYGNFTGEFSVGFSLAVLKLVAIYESELLVVN
jgi:hypothetical protein